jgi:hypothetical protein
MFTNEKRASKPSFNQVLTSFTAVISGEIEHDPEKNETGERKLSVS